MRKGLNYVSKPTTKSEACKLRRWQLIHIFSTGQHPSCIHIKSSLNASWLQPGGVSDEEHIWNQAWHMGAARRDRGGSDAHVTSITTGAWASVAPWISDGNSIPRVTQSGVTVAFCHPSDRHPSLRNLDIFCQKPSATVRETKRVGGQSYSIFIFRMRVERKNQGLGRTKSESNLASCQVQVS